MFTGTGGGGGGLLGLVFDHMEGVSGFDSLVFHAICVIFHDLASEDELDFIDDHATFLGNEFFELADGLVWADLDFVGSYAEVLDLDAEFVVHL